MIEMINHTVHTRATAVHCRPDSTGSVIRLANGHRTARVSESADVRCHGADGLHVAARRHGVLRRTRQFNRAITRDHYLILMGYHFIKGIAYTRILFVIIILRNYSLSAQSHQPE